MVRAKLQRLRNWRLAEMERELETLRHIVGRNMLPEAGD